MGRVKRTSKSEIVCLSVAATVLVLVTLLHGAAIGFDLWLHVKNTNREGKLMVGLWKICHIFSNDDILKLYSKDNENCTSINQIAGINHIALEEGWNVELYVTAVMSILISAALLILGIMFFCCAFIPSSRCRTVGQGGLPAVLITSGVFQICCLVTSYLAIGSPPLGDDVLFGLSYYLLLGCLIPTWLLGIGTIITACRA